MMWGHVDYLCVLLGIMGAQLKSLKIVCPSDAMNTNAVLEACPNLDRMELWRGFTNVRFAFTESQQQHKRLETLTYDGCGSTHRLRLTWATVPIPWCYLNGACCCTA
jgi:hypothetical protein